MAAYVKYNDFVEQLCKAIHDLDGTHVLKVALSNTAPVATNTVLGDITEIGAGNGYTAGGTATTPTITETPAGTANLVCTDVVFTASGGSIGPFRYAVLYNDTPASPLNPLIASWDYGSNVTLLDTETFTVDFDGVNGVFDLA